MDRLVNDVTNLNPNAAFRSDIQISQFRTSLNSDLVRTYMFTSGTFREKKSSADLLERLRDSAESEVVENRFLVKANFGHGKSHFALAVANFFGKAGASEEVATLLRNLEHTINDSAAAKTFREFKRHRKPYLVILLRGDAPGDLRDKFFQGLYDGLKDHDETRDVHPPFWFEKAERFLDGLKEEERRQAEAFLEARRQDLAGLRRQVQGHMAGSYRICTELCHHIRDVWPDWGRETSITDALTWAAQNLCGATGPLGGVLILFDEFSVFARDYVASQTTGVPLQELLNGVERNRGKVLFVAFAQHEPEVVAKDDGSTEYENLKKELTRIPKPGRFTLQTSLEDVLRAYFRSDIDAWKWMLSQPGIAGQVVEASDVAFECLRPHYESALHWTPEEFQDRVARACFPLHPLTTVLLASVELEAVTNRGVLNFLKDADGPLQRSLERPAVADAKPNWVVPISLVDYFQNALGERAWTQYQSVYQADLSDAQKAVLKAMMLQTAAHIPSKGVGYPVLIGQLCGLPESEAAAVLQGLERARYVRYDAGNRTYSFWAGTNVAQELDRLLNEEMTDRLGASELRRILDIINADGTNQANDLIDDKAGLGVRYPVSVPWGHPEDWAAREVVLTRASCERSTLERLAKRYEAPAGGMPECRGLVLLCLARTDEDVEWFSTNLQQVLEQSRKLTEAPILCLRPDRPTPELVENVIKYTILNDGGFSTRATPLVGLTVFNEEKERYAKQIREELLRLRKVNRFEAPSAARGGIRALSIPRGAADRVERALKEVYRICYHRRPGEFFTHLRVVSQGPNNLRSAVTDLVPVLVENNLAQAYAGLSVVAQEVVNKFLKPPSAWGMVSDDSKLKPPSGADATKGWEALEEKLPATEVPVKLAPAIRELTNVPYGYDFHTLAILLAAWLGYNRLGIRVFEDGRKAVQISEMVLDSKGKKLKPKDFLEKLSNATVSRQNRERDRERAREWVEKVEAGGLSRAEGEEALAFLRTAKAADQISDPALVGNVDIAIDKLETGLKHQEDYDKEAEKVRAAIDRGTQVEKLAAQLEAVKKLATPVTVAASMPSAPELRQAVIDRISVVTREQCQKLERLGAITEYGQNEKTLKEMSRELQRHGLIVAHERVTSALATLAEEKTRLQAREREKHDIAIVRNLPVTGNLETLRAARAKLRELQEQHTADAVLEAVLERTVLVLEAIEHQEKYVGALDERLDAVASLKEAQALDRDILAERKAFEGSPEWATLGEAAERCQRLMDFFRELEAPLPESPECAVRLRGRIEALPTELEGVLSEPQRVLAAGRLAELAEHCARQESHAREWLTAKRAQVERGDFKAVERELSSAPCFLPEDLVPEVEDLRARARHGRASKEQEERVLKAISALPIEGRLVDLRAALSSLDEYLSGTPEVVARAEEKRGKLESAISRLETQGKQWPSQLDALTCAQEVQKLRDAIQRASAAYAGTEFAEGIDGLVVRCDAVRGALAVVEKRSPLADRRTADESLDRLRAAMEQPGLSLAHVQQLEAAVADIRKLVHEKQQEAVRWLESLEGDLAAGKDPRGSRSRLQTVPGFLSADLQARLAALSAGIDEALRRQREDARIQERLQGLQRVHALAALREQQGKVRDWLRAAWSDGLREALSRRDQKLSAEIEDRLGSLRALHARVESMSTLEEARTLMSALHGELSTFRGAPEEEGELAALQVRARKLQEYFEALQAASQQAIEVRADVHKGLARIAELVGNLDGDLAPTHRGAAAAAEEQIRKAVREKERHAELWLGEQRAKLAEGRDLEMLEQILRAPPAFLPEQALSELESIRCEVTQRLDKDLAARVVKEFQRIKDAAKRRECLQRLESLLEVDLT